MAGGFSIAGRAGIRDPGVRERTDMTGAGRTMKTAESLKGREKGHRGCGGIVELAILVVLPVLFHYLMPVMVVITPPYTYTGAVIMFLGLGLMIWAAAVFGKAGTGFQLQTGGTVLVTSGPFRFSRNPMYLGMLLWLTGLAVLLGSLIAFVFPVLFFLLAHCLIIPMEEKKMEQAAKEQYTIYRKHVRRWL